MKYRYLLILLLFTSCSHTNQNFGVRELQMNDINNYDSVHLVPNFFMQLDSSLLYPEELWVFDSILVISDKGYKYEKHDFIRFYNIKTGELIQSFGKIGRGPGEYITPSFFKQSNNELLITEKMKYSILNIHSLLLKPLYIPQKINLEGGGTAVNYASKLNDSILFYHSNSPWQFSLLNIRTNERKDFNNFPSVVSNPSLTDFIANTKVYAGNYAVNKKSLSKYCVVYNYFPIIDIVSIQDRNILRVSFPINKNINNVVIVDDLNAVIENRHYYHGDICTTDLYIYYIFHNLNNRYEIHKFNWDGDFLKRYILDEQIKTLDIDEKSTRIYALVRNSNYEVDIVFYDL